MDNNYILLWRSILDSEVFAHEGLLKVWIWCLSKASFKSRPFKIKVGRGETTIKLKRGQFLYGRKVAAEELHMAPGTVRNRMQKLQEMGNVDIQPDSHYSIVTIINWDRYQIPPEEERPADWPTKGQAKDNQRTSKGQAKDTYNKGNKVDNENNENKRGDEFFEEDPLAYMSNDMGQDEILKIVDTYREVYDKAGYKPHHNVINRIVERTKQYKDRHKNPVEYVIRKAKKLADEGDAFYRKKKELGSLLSERNFAIIFEAEDPGDGRPDDVPDDYIRHEKNGKVRWLSPNHFKEVSG